MAVNPLFIAVSLIILSGFVLAGMDSLGKVLMETFDTQQVTWARYFFHAIFVALLFRAYGHTDFLVPKAPKIQILRGISVLGVTFALYTSIQTISLAEATAILYLSPVLITLLAGVFLGEKIGRSHIIAVILGFLGVLMITKPGFQAINSGMLLALLSSFFLSIYFILTSKVKDIDNVRTSLFYSSIVGAVILTLMSPLWWKTPSLTHWLLFILMGALGAFGHFLIIKAYSLISASVLSPYLNAQVVAATLFSVFFFGDKLAWNFFVGTALIITAGVYLWAHERYYRNRG